MLRVPASNHAFGDRPPPASAQESVCSLHRSLVTSPQGTIYIGSGAFGTVRLGWLQERRKNCKRILTSKGEKTRTTIILGACAAVAVKRVMVPKTNDGPCRYRRQLLLREIQVMERIRMYPHPNIVQCWGFIFGKKEKDQTPDHCNPSSDSTDGTVLTSLSKEGHRMSFNDDKNDGDDLTDQQILEGASYVDLCLSLCTGGTLRDYVVLKANEAPHAVTAWPEWSASGSQTESGTMASETMRFDRVGGTHGLTGSTNEGTASYGCDSYGAHHTHTPQTLDKGKEPAKVSSNLSHAFISISYQLAVPERDIVAIVYALVHALRHTHETLRTLHRDIKPSNVLIFSGVGRTPEYALQSSSLPFEVACGGASRGRDTMGSGQARPLILRGDSGMRGTLGEGGDSVEFSLFPEHPAAPQGFTDALRWGVGRNSATPTAAATGGTSRPTGEPPATLVVPLGLGQYRLPYAAADSPRSICIDCLPQVEGWRIQLADFGVTTGVGQLAGSGRCGTVPFMAPEVVHCADHGASTRYTTKADIYSLGVTLQHMLLHLIVGDGEGSQGTRSHAEILGAQWIDEDDTAAQSRLVSGTGLESNDTTTESQPKFRVPNAWRCDKELDEGDYIRCGSVETESPKHGVDEDMEHQSEATGFAVPRAWRCRKELLERHYIRRELSSKRSDADIHAHLLTPLPKELTDAKENVTARERRGSRCSSCGKIHRHLIELLNAMTAKKPSKRPSLSTVLQSAAIIERGTFLETRRPPSPPATAVGDKDVDDDRSTSQMNLNSPGKEVAAERFFRARRRAEERSHLRPPPTGFRFDMTTPSQEDRQEKNGDGEDDTTVLLWRPPSLSFLRASRNKMEAHNR